MKFQLRDRNVDDLIYTNLNMLIVIIRCIFCDKDFSNYIFLVIGSEFFFNCSIDSSLHSRNYQCMLVRNTKK